MAITIQNPYGETPCQWLRGNLHTHTTNSDGNRPPQEVVDAYVGYGYDFLMISDHDTFTDPNELSADGMVLIPGVEVTAEGVHILQAGSRDRVHHDPDRQKVIDGINATGAIAIVTHPNWEKHFNHCDQANLEQWQRYAGIEIANAICILAEGSGYAADRWDMLLGKGRRVWGYGHDDTHNPDHDAGAWNVVQCDDRDPAAIIDALRNGRHYVSTGGVIDTIRVEGDTITVESPGTQRIIAVSDFGRRLTVVDDARIEFTVPDDSPYSYVRFECLGPCEQYAYTQPFFFERD
ncbi:MAG: CehA/McbA family metallohydrolase [bacterium]|nr:CehA/McbA family metallohydrolase [bacterium]